MPKKPSAPLPRPPQPVTRYRIRIERGKHPLVFVISTAPPMLFSSGHPQLGMVWDPWEDKDYKTIAALDWKTVTAITWAKTRAPRPRRRKTKRRAAGRRLQRLMKRRRFEKQDQNAPK